MHVTQCDLLFHVMHACITQPLNPISIRDIFVLKLILEVN